MIINVLSAIATALSLGGNIFLAKQKIIVFPMWIIANVMWCYIIIATSMNISQLLMYFVYIFTAIYSWYSWKKN